MDTMLNFSLINYRDIILQFEKEEKAGRRYKMGDLKTSLWLKKNDINFGELREISNELPDPRLVIIGEGSFSGFYIYSNKLRKCYKNSFANQSIFANK
jgi:hypothetical protein